MRHISRSARQRVAKRRKKRLCLAIGLALVLFALQQIDQAIRPLTRQVVQYQCRAQAVQTIQTACNSILEQNSSLYEDLYTVQRDDTGRVQSVAVNSARINTLEDALVEQVNQSLYQLQQLPLHIPLGTLTGIQLFSNLGPEIAIHVQPLSLVTSQVQSDFSQAGVNQTRLEVTVCFSVQIGALLAGEVIPVDAQTEVLAAQILIVGEVPQLYAQSGGSAEKA